MVLPPTTDDRRPDGLADQPTLWQGSNTPLASIVVYLPLLIVFGLFAVVFALFAAMTDQATMRVGLALTGYRSMALRLNEAAIVRFAFVYLVPLAIVALLVLPIWRISRVRLSMTTGAVVVRDRGLTVVWPHDAIRALHVRDMLWWRIARFTPVSGKAAQIVLSRRRMDELIAVSRSIGIDIADTKGSDRPPALAAGERILWSGRPGFGALSLLQVSTLAVLLVPMALFVWALVAIWSGVDDVGNIPALAMAFFWTLAALFVIGWTAAAMAYAAWASFAGPIGYALGRLVVSDRRIGFVAPVTGHIFREIASSDIVGATLIEAQGDRGWISVELRNAERADDPVYIDLTALPDAQSALAAINRIARA